MSASTQFITLDSSSIKISLKNTTRSIQNKVRIVDTNGVTLKEAELGTIDQQDYELEINTSQYPPGVYFVE